MLAGLIFATGDAEGSGDALAATLPIGGLTLLEFQARLLANAGVTQIVIVVARLTPALLGSINRIARRVGSVDAVRTAAEAAEKLHPLARVLVVADGLVTTSDVVSLLTDGDKDALLVTDTGSGAGYERVGAMVDWAGLALLTVKHVGEVAAFPKDYDFQSTLLRVAAQDGAHQLRLPPAGDMAGHGIERNPAALAERGGMILQSLVSTRTSWAERFVFAPIARRLLPVLTARVVPTAVLVAAAVALTLAGFIAVSLGYTGIGLGCIAVATGLFFAGVPLASLRDEDRLVVGARVAIVGASALCGLLIGRQVSLATGTATGWTMGVGFVAAAMLAERAGRERTRRVWWASPAAYPLVMLPLAILGQPLAALGVAAGYATVTLAAAIERLREKP